MSSEEDILMHLVQTRGATGGGIGKGTCFTPLKAGVKIQISSYILFHVRSSITHHIVCYGVDATAFNTLTFIHD